jgi:chaperonin GroES
MAKKKSVKKTNKKIKNIKKSPSKKVSKTPSKKVLAKAKKAAPKKVALKAAKKPASKATVQSSQKSKSEVDFFPLADRVLVEQGDGFSKTDGGIFIPDAYQEKPLEGKVLRVGPGFRSKKGVLRPLDLKVGDKVLFTKYAGSKIQLDGSNFLILKESDIIGVVTK